MPDILTEVLSCTLTEEEMAKLAAELGNLQQQLDELKVTRKTLVKLIEEKSAIAVSGQEFRDVAVEWIDDIPSRRKRLIRVDNGHEVRNVFLTDSELQGKLI